MYPIHVNNSARQVVTASIKSLTKARFKALCELKSLAHQRHIRDVSGEEEDLMAQLTHINLKLGWELRTHGALLGKTPLQ